LPDVSVKSALQFYEHQLGFQVAALMPAADYAILERDAIGIHLFQDPTRAHSPVGIHVFPSALEELRDDFVEQGARLWQDIMRPWGTRDFRLRDDFGNELKFTELSEED
jgi:uncharacterized glyoxalase superfamily protein PhnB